MEYTNCPFCHKGVPEYTLKNGRCMLCDIEIHRLGQSIIPFIGAEGYCQYCYKKLRPIGSARKNGANHDDWEDRKYHKKCNKDIIKNQ